MPNQWDLTGENIENTYQRVLQTPDGVNIYDGTGSLFTVTAVAAPAGPNQSVQFNDAGTTSGSSNFTFNKATNAVTLTGSLNITDSIYFSGSGAASRLRWNDTDGTLDLGLKGGNVTLQIGQEQVIRVVNKTGADLLESQYKAVRIRRFDEGGAQGQRLAIVLAQANNDTNSVDTLGLVTENIAVNQEGFITTFGLVRDIDTTGTLQGETWNDGDVLYLSPTTPGAVTNIKPQAPNHTIILGYVVYKQQNQGKIFVKVDNGYEIDELHNVRINTASLTAGQLLVRSGSNNDGLWINSNQLTGSYGLTGSLNATLGFTGSLFGTASWAQSASQALTASFYRETDPIFVSKSASLATTGSNTFIGNQVVSGSFIIDTASSDAVLRITQTGTGNALTVEDSTNPDATPFVIDATGKVGIGTSSPQYAIVASSSTATDTIMFFDGGTAANANLVAAADTSIKLPLLVLSDRTNAYSINTSYWIGLDRASTALYASRNDALYVNNYLDKGHYFITNDTATGKKVRMVISGSGNVGIGTTTPSALLHVSSSTQENGAIIEVSSSLTSSAALRITQTGNGNAIVVEDSANPDSTPFIVAPDGKVLIGTTTPTTSVLTLVGNQSVTGNIYITNAVQSGTANRLFLGASANANSYFNAGGNLGVGTTSPAYRLDVSGSSRITGDLTVTGVIDGGTF